MVNPQESFVKSKGKGPIVIGVYSEVSRLKKVLVHTPGPETEQVTPRTAHELLFNDIIHVQDMRQEHAQLTQVLKLVCEVYDIRDCLTQVLDIDEARQNLLKEITLFQRCPEIYDELIEMPSRALAKVLIEGHPLRRETFSAVLSKRNFSIVPLPNMYFMRDSSFVVGPFVVTPKMATAVRHAEASILKTVYKYHPQLHSEEEIIDFEDHASVQEVHIEGGDVLVYNKDCLLVGISPRTSASALDCLVDKIVRARRVRGDDSVFDVIGVLLPDERSTIHLDMIFTFASHNHAVIYAPYVLGREKCRVIQIRIKPNGGRAVREHDDVLSALNSLGKEIEPILCGGTNPLYQQREQWGSGTNVFAFGPGQILSYDMHEQTLKGFEKAGFKILHTRDVIKNPDLLKTDEHLVVALEGNELARGGGGPRCMTCPVLRENDA